MASTSNISYRIRLSREEAGLTQNQLAERAGVSLSAVKKWEGGVHKPSADSLAVIAEALGVGAGELLADTAAV